MTACNTTTITIQPNDSEKLFYSDLDKYIDSLSVKFREKSVIKKKVCEDIVQALLLQKGKTSGSFSPKFVFWAKQNFLLLKIVGIDIACCVKTKKPVCIYESFFNVISECHVSVSHGGRDKTVCDFSVNWKE
ncbi:unnamed protein product [Didymodactylos carnosus]|uniref:Uncharacterized protein n=1 Tax=Didymodactylos carnosus TaxID=1234261 RepID=A0A816C7D6_9BILA|nr:unnamed protein product [Didymodactylos carnosus]CAF4508896.1 unnamed protein product [Didymodactylos carnosus]